MTRHEQDAVPRPPRRRRPRWAKYAVVVLLGLSAFWGWVGLQVHWAQRQRLAAEAIAKLGGKAYYEYELIKEGHIYFSNPDGESPHPRWIKQVLGEDVFAQVLLIDMGRLPGVNDDTLVHLRDMPKLKVADLQFTNVSDAGLSHLSRLDRLEHLLLASPKITSAGLVHFKGLTRLKVLRLFRADIRDEDLSQLAHLKDLEVLVVSASKISERAASEFMRDRPRCEVVRIP